MVERMKTHYIGLRVDPKTKELLQEAHSISGVPTSEITRRGAVAEALRVISLYRGNVKQVTTISQHDPVMAGHCGLSAEESL